MSGEIQYKKLAEVDPETGKPKNPLLSKTVLSGLAGLIATGYAFIAAKTKLPPEVVEQMMAPIVVSGIAHGAAIVTRIIAKVQLKWPWK